MSDHGTPDDSSTERSSSATPFFADAILDLETAHDIAETPEAAPKPIVRVQGPNLALPSSSPREKTSFSRITAEVEILQRPRGIPRWPRDLAWAVAFYVTVPTSLLWPFLAVRAPTSTSPLALHPLSTSTLHTLFWASAAALVMSRWLYRTVAGGEGDDARHAVASVLSLAAPIAVGVQIALAIFVSVTCPTARAATLIPLFYVFRDVYLYRRWKRRSEQSGSGSRQAFFQALTSMALDILSRSLRRASFYRVLTSLLVVQLGLVLWWRWAVLRALASGSAVMVVAALVAGRWATATLTRLLSLLATGGVTGWLDEQSHLLAELPVTAFAGDDNENDDYHYDEEDENGPQSDIPEAYRTVDASVYQSVLDMDDALDDDDYEDEEELATTAPSQREAARRASLPPIPRSTVKSLLLAGLTVSFGSVAQCALLGGVAQFVWSQVRKVEQAQTALAEARQGRQGLVAMPIGRRQATLWSRLGTALSHLARGFVCRFSDLALAHVAVYYKSYQKAARDVTDLIEESGVEPILHDDISTHMCASVGGAVAGLIVLLTGSLAAHQKRPPAVTDWHMAENLLVAFVLAYTLIMTVMEPLRAAIKASYVAFAQHPQSLSQAFPLIYHRLTRLSSSNTR